MKNMEKLRNCQTRGDVVTKCNMVSWMDFGREKRTLMKENGDI